MNNHLVRKCCPSTSDKRDIRIRNAMTSYIRRHLNSIFFIEDDILELMIDGLTDIDTVMFLDGLIIAGKQFNYKKDSIRVPLSFCRYFVNDEPILGSLDPNTESPVPPPDFFIINTFGKEAIELKIEKFL